MVELKNEPILLSDILTAQHAVLSAMLVRPDCVGSMIAKLSDEDFLSAECRTVFQAIRAVFSDGAKVDPLLVAERLTEGRDAAQAAQWRQLLADLIEISVSTVNSVELYADMMQQQARLSRLKGIGEQLWSAQSMEEAENLLEHGNALLADREKLKVVDMEAGLLDFFDRHDSKDEALTWCFDEFNRDLHVCKGDFVVIGGYPSAGKTAYALQEAWQMSKTQRVGFFSLETDDGKIFDRLVSYVTGIDFRKIKRSELSQDDYTLIKAMYQRFQKRSLEVIPFAGYSIPALQAMALSRRYDVIFIDYLQLLPAEGKSRYEVVTNISLALHRMAQRHGITVIALAQLTRPEKSKMGKLTQPSMSSFRESGQIEQDADVAMILYSDNPDLPNAHRWLKVVKNKEGPVSKVYLSFEPHRQRFKKDVHHELAKTQRTEAPYAQFEALPEDTPIPKAWDVNQMSMYQKGGQRE